MLSKLIAALEPSAIGAVFDHAADLRRQGVDLVDFSVGEPDFDTPAHICSAGKAAIDAGHTRYTAADGNAEIKTAVSEKFRRDNGLTYDPSNIVVASGAKPLLAAAVQALLNPGDEVILPTPLWSSHLGMIQAIGSTPICIETGNTGFKLTAEALDRAITPRTRLLMICSPSNPTGAVLGAGELSDLARVLRAHPGVCIISDDLYEHIVFDGANFATLAAVAPDLATRILTVNGVSKAYAMTGWRIGYAGGPDWWIKGIRALFGQTNGGPSSISQAAAIAALTGPQDHLAKWCRIYQDRRDRVLSGLRAIKGLEVETPGGAFYVMPNCAGLLGRRSPDGRIIDSSTALSAYFLDHGVVVVPGPGFACDPYFRMSFATSEDRIAEGIARMTRAISKLTA